MIIVSQDKTEIINFDNVNTLRATKTGFIVSYENTYKAEYDCSNILGKYKTESRAKEVLKEIVNRYADVSMSNIIENLGITIHDRDFGGNASSVYKMPKE